MGTRSRIGVMHGDNCKSVYCHWDGYISHNGRILDEYYDSTKANSLVALGDLSSLCPDIDPGNDNHSFEHPKLGVTIFYGRDRGETGVDYKVSATFEDFLKTCNDCDAEYYYIMKDGVWYVGDNYTGTKLSQKLTLLSEVLEAETELAN